MALLATTAMTAPATCSAQSPTPTAAHRTQSATTVIPAALHVALVGQAAVQAATLALFYKVTTLVPVLYCGAQETDVS